MTNQINYLVLNAPRTGPNNSQDVLRTLKCSQQLQKEEMQMRLPIRFLKQIISTSKDKSRDSSTKFICLITGEEGASMPFASVRQGYELFKGRMVTSSHFTLAPL